MKRISVLIMGLIMLSACTTFQSIKEDVITRVDPISITDQAKFNADMDECARYAQEANRRYQNEVTKRAIVGMILGAAVGAAVGHGFGSTHTGAGAAYGAAYGAARFPIGTPNWYYSVIGNCLVHRGYLLLY